MSWYTVIPEAETHLEGHRVVSFDFGWSVDAYLFRIAGSEDILHESVVTEGELFFKLWILRHATNKVVTIEGPEAESLDYLLNRLRYGAPI